MKDYIFIDQDIETLREEIHTKKIKVYKRLVDQCKRYEAVQLNAEHPNGSTTFMGMAIANLALAYVLTQNKRYLTEVKRWMDQVVDYPHWGNAHLVDVDLSAAWILFGLGIGYDWLKDDLSENQRLLIKEKLILQGNRMYDFKINTEGTGWSTNYFQNHNWINMTGLATAGYALKDTYEMSQAWIESSKSNFETVFSMLPEDGSDYEGVVYWRYGVMWLFIYAHLIKERENINYFEQSNFLKETFYYRLYQSAPNLEEIINFGDCHDRRSGHSTAIYYKVAAEYKNGYAQKLGNLVRDEFLYREAYESKIKPGILPECFFEVLFYDPQIQEKDFSDLPTKKFFPDLGLYIYRSSWSADALHFSFKCGAPGGKRQWENLWRLKESKNYNCFGLSHQHPDNNSFILVSNETYYAIDDGYNRTVKASDHNTITVDGLGYQDEGQNNIWKNYTKDMISEIETCQIDDQLTYIVGEASKQYDSKLNLSVAKRHIVHMEMPYIVMIDELDSKDEHIYTWTMHSDFYPEVSSEASSEVAQHYLYQGDYGKMSLFQFTSHLTEHKLADNTIRAIMTTQEPDKFTENKMKALKISNIAKTQKMIFLSILAPTNDDVVAKRIKCEGAIVIEVSTKKDKLIYVWSELKAFEFKGEKCPTRLTIFEKAQHQYIKRFSLGEVL
ncbi:DUF4962 domain-containing protein [Fusibacter bizertensis]